MGIKIKCQHCWKVFEVPDHALNKEQKCIFCQRVTKLKPVESKKEKITRQMKIVLDESEDKRITTLLNIALAGMLLLTMVNFALGGYLLFSDGSRTKAGEEGDTAQKLAELEKNIVQCNNSLEKVKSNIKPSKELVSPMIKIVMKNFEQIISKDYLGRIKDQIKQLKENQ